jgi:hypothetical protein
MRVPARLTVNPLLVCVAMTAPFALSITESRLVLLFRT